MSNLESNNTPLGLTQIPGGTFEHDLSISDRYQSFSSELLKLALAGIAVFGFLVSNGPWEKANVVVGAKLQAGLGSENFKIFAIISLLSFGISAACSLAHRY